MKHDLIEVSPALDYGNAYATGDRLGAIQELPGAAGRDGFCSLLKSISIVDLSNQKQAIDLFFFSELPTVASADNLAIDIADAQLAKMIGHVNIPAASYVEIKASNNAIVSVKNIDMELRNKAGSTSIWVVAVIRGSATYAASKGLLFRYGIETI